MSSSNSNNCCKECADRYIGCHDRCDKYQAFKQARANIKSKIMEAKNRDNIIIEFKQESIKRAKKKHRY